MKYSLLFLACKCSLEDGGELMEVKIKCVLAFTKTSVSLYGKLD